MDLGERKISGSGATEDESTIIYRGVHQKYCIDRLETTIQSRTTVRHYFSGAEDMLRRCRHQVMPVTVETIRYESV